MSSLSDISSSSQTAIIDNLTTIVQDLWPLLIYIIIFTGIVLCGWSVWNFVKAQREGLRGGSGYIFTFIAGVCMSSISAILNVSSESFFNTNSPASLSLNISSSQTGEYGALVSLIFDFVALWGLWAYYKSFLLLRESGDDRHNIGPAIWHFLGGAFAVNMKTVLSVLGVSLGGLFQTAIQNIVGS